MTRPDEPDDLNAPSWCRLRFEPPAGVEILEPLRDGQGALVLPIRVERDDETERSAVEFLRALHEAVGVLHKELAVHLTKRALARRSVPIEVPRG